MNKIIKKTLIVISLAFIAFASGRIGHIYGGQLPTPHHWIYGAICIIIAIIFFKKKWSAYLFAFGLGLLISDFIDFTQLKTFEPDLPGNKVFWGVD